MNHFLPEDHWKQKNVDKSLQEHLKREATKQQQKVNESIVLLMTKPHPITK